MGHVPQSAQPTKGELAVSVDLVQASRNLVSLLIAVDTLPLGVNWHWQQRPELHMMLPLPLPLCMSAVEAVWAHALTCILHGVCAGGLYDGPYAQLAVERYQLHWLPYFAKTPEPARGMLVPPLDVSYVWLCHRLNPDAYKADCQRLLDGKEVGLFPFGYGTTFASLFYWPPTFVTGRPASHSLCL